MSQINATHLFASWTDGGLMSQGGADKGVYYRAAGFPAPDEAQAMRGGKAAPEPWCTDVPSKSAVKNCKQMPDRGYSTGYGIISFTSAADGVEPTITLENLGTVHAVSPHFPRAQHSPARNFSSCAASPRA